jgi:hypothetical protein
MIQGPSGAGSVAYTGIDPSRTEQTAKPAHITQSAGLPQGLDDKHTKDATVDLTETPAAPAAFAGLRGTEERVKQAADVNVDVITVMFKAMQQMKETASKDRQMSLDAHVATLLDSAQKLMEAAGERKSAAVSAAVGAMVGSCVSLVGNALALRIATTGGAEAENYNTTLAKIWQSTSESLSGISSAGGKLDAARHEFEADLLNAQSKAIDALAAMHEKRYQEDSDLRSTAVQAQNAVSDYLKAVAQSTVDVAKGTARNL